jgi:hypothetical protein
MTTTTTTALSIQPIDDPDIDLDLDIAYERGQESGTAIASQWWNIKRRGDYKRLTRTQFRDMEVASHTRLLFGPEYSECGEFYRQGFLEAFKAYFRNSSVKRPAGISNRTPSTTAHTTPAATPSIKSSIQGEE